MLVDWMTIIIIMVLCLMTHVKDFKNSKYLMRRINSHETFNFLKNKLTQFSIQNFYISTINMYSKDTC